jgi:hypothetical protein
MPTPKEMTVGSDVALWMPAALHDLCQPLTALECGLFVGTMSPDGVRGPRAEELLATILEALAQCERLTLSIRAMQARMAGMDSN